MRIMAKYKVALFPARVPRCRLQMVLAQSRPNGAHPHFYPRRWRLPAEHDGLEAVAERECAGESRNWSRHSPEPPPAPGIMASTQERKCIIIFWFRAIGQGKAISPIFLNYLQAYTLFSLLIFLTNFSMPLVITAVLFKQSKGMWLATEDNTDAGSISAIPNPLGVKGRRGLPIP